MYSPDDADKCGLYARLRQGGDIPRRYAMPKQVGVVGHSPSFSLEEVLREAIADLSPQPAYPDEMFQLHVALGVEMGGIQGGQRLLVEVTRRR